MSFLNPGLLLGYIDIRLAGGESSCEGRVELKTLGAWGPLCSSHWDMEDAHVLCQQLKCGVAQSIPEGAHFGKGAGQVWSHMFHCTGTEEHIGDCLMTALGAPTCSEGQVASVICSGERMKGRASDEPLHSALESDEPESGMKQKKQKQSVWEVHETCARIGTSFVLLESVQI